MVDNLTIADLKQVDSRHLQITWSDGKEALYDVVDLRRQCPCALCVDEITNKRTLKPEDVSEDVRPIRIDSVGSYALTIKFSDQHSTGIYTFELLRKLQKSGRI